MSKARPVGWMPLAYAEHDTTNGLYPPESVLTPERLKATAASFNPDLFTPPILSAPSGSMGEVHRTATKGGGHKLGELDALDFDGATLWGRGTEIADRCGTCRGTGKACQEGCAYFRRFGQGQRARAAGRV